MNVAVLGGTGLIGKNVLSLLARLNDVSYVYAPIRGNNINERIKSIDANIYNLWKSKASKFEFEIVDFNAKNISAHLTEKFKRCNAIICCIGTTLKLAKSKRAQQQIDLGLPLKIAAYAKKAGVENFLCVSAQGANPNSPFFYNRLKGMLESGLTMLNFKTLTLVRPSLLLGKHSDKRFGEDILQKIFGAHPEFLPSFFRPVHAQTVAAHLVTSMLKPPLNHICASDGTIGKRIIYNRTLAKTKVDELF